MNKHIKQFERESNLDVYGLGLDRAKWETAVGKFAELIVRECIEQGNTLANHYINTHPEQEQVMLLASIADYSSEIRKHFGVEE